MSEELKTCSRCHSTILLKYFSENRHGALYKLCNNCRNGKKKKVISNEDRIIASARHQFIQGILEKWEGKVKYIGPLPDNSYFPIPEPSLDEDVVVELHLFEMVDDNHSQLVHRWRLRTKPV